MENLKTDLNDPAFRNILVYLSRTDSLIKFVDEKIIKLRGRLFSDLETHEIIEAFVIKYICDWEWFIERHFTHLLTRNTSKLAEYLTLKIPQIITFDEGTAILNGTGYFDFKNCTDIKSQGKKFLTVENNPFPAIEKDVTQNIDNLYIIRNYIAHKSNKSKKTLTKFYSENGITNFIEPGEYLIKLHVGETAPKFTNLYTHTFSLFMSVFQMWESLFPKSFDELKVNGEFNEKSMQKLLLLLNFRSAGE
jgi:hypothetical protein